MCTDRNREKEFPKSGYFLSKQQGKLHREIKIQDLKLLQPGISVHEEFQICSHFVTFPNWDANLSLRSLSMDLGIELSYMCVIFHFKKMKMFHAIFLLLTFLKQCRKIKCLNMTTISCKHE